MGRLSAHDRANVVEIMTQPLNKANTTTKRANLLKKGIPSNIADELIVLNETCMLPWIAFFSCLLCTLDDDLPTFLFHIGKLSTSLRREFHSAIDDMRATVELAILSGVMRPIYVTPLMLGSRHEYFKNGVCFEVCKRNKRHDLLAAGGR